MVRVYMHIYVCAYVRMPCDSTGTRVGQEVGWVVGLWLGSMRRCKCVVCSVWWGVGYGGVWYVVCGGVLWRGVMCGVWCEECGGQVCCSGHVVLQTGSCW